MEAQRKAVFDYLNGGQWELHSEYTEIESGKRNKRPQLQAALKACKKHQATLVIAKLDRLSRDAHFLLGLQKSKLNFVACDMPNANRLTIGIMALVAEEEGRMISARTKVALAAAKERGVELGRNGKEILSVKNRKKADEFALLMKPLIEQLEQSGYTTERTIAEQLNLRGIPTARGGDSQWHQPTVHHVIKRIERLRLGAKRRSNPG